MAVATKQRGRSGTNRASQQQPQAAKRAMIPFDQASKRFIETGPSWEVTPGTTPSQLGPYPLPARAWLRQVEIEVEGVGGSSGTVGKEGVTNAILQARMQDTNGNQFDDISGYVLGLDNIFGAIAGGAPDYRNDVDYVGTGSNIRFQLLLGRELAPNGFGSIANMAATQAFKLMLRINTKAAIWSTEGTVPALRVRTFMHGWELPEPYDMEGNPQLDEPPKAGTAQYRWLSQGNAVSTGFRLPITQVGSRIRMIVLIGRKSNGERTYSVFPEPFNFRWDSDLLLVCGLSQLRKIAREMIPNMQTWETTAGTGALAGVLPILFNFGQGRLVGGTGVNSLLPTSNGTRLEIYGTAAEAGEIENYVNDVSEAQMVPALRPQSPGIGGFEVEMGQKVAGAR